MFQVGIPFRNVQRPENKRDIFGLITDLLNSIGNEQFFVATIDKTAFFFCRNNKTSLQYNIKER